MLPSLSPRFLCVLCVLCGSIAFADEPVTVHVDHAGLLKLGWQLACRGSTFRDRTTFEMIDLLHSMNFHHIELSAGHAVSSDLPGAIVSTDMTPAATDALLAKLKSVHMDVVSFSGFDPGKTEAEARKVFDLGKKLKIKTIVADPADDSLQMLDKLATEYQINIAVEDFQKSSLLAGLSKRMGVCVDLVAWKKSGLSPLTCVQKLKGRILMLHLSDIDDHDHETVLNGGVVGADDVLSELKAQGFRGICSVEYDTGSGDELVRNFTASVNAFSDIVSRLSGEK